MQWWYTPEVAVGSALSEDTPATSLEANAADRAAEGSREEASARDTEWGMVLAAVWKLPEDSLPGSRQDGGLRNEFDRVCVRGDEPWLKERPAGAWEKT